MIQEKAKKIPGPANYNGHLSLDKVTRPMKKFWAPLSNESQQSQFRENIRNKQKLKDKIHEKYSILSYTLSWNN